MNQNYMNTYRQIDTAKEMIDNKIKRSNSRKF